MVVVGDDGGKRLKSECEKHSKSGTTSIATAMIVVWALCLMRAGGWQHVKRAKLSPVIPLDDGEEDKDEPENAATPAGLLTPIALYVTFGVILGICIIVFAVLVVRRIKYGVVVLNKEDADKEEAEQRDEVSA
jgi:hypothetical protein